MPLTLNGTTGVAGIDGSASTPSLQGADTNTGIWFPAADTVAIATSGSERMRVDSSGNVGIGTTSPSGKFFVKSSTDQSTIGTFSGASYAVRIGTTASVGAVVEGVDITGSASYQPLIVGGSQLQFTISSSERARITSSGDLCVGTTSSGGYKLRVDGATGAYITTTGANTAIYGYASGSGVGVNGYSQSNYAMYGLAANTYGIYGQTANAGYGGVIGYSANGYNYGIIGYANAWALYGLGSAYVSGTYQGSDERLKENIQDLGNSLDKIAQLRAVTFDWKPNTDASLNGAYADVGLIAQEAINVLPNIVKETTAPPVLEGKTPTLNQELGTFYTIDYGKLIPYMVDAIQELKQQNDALAARVAALEAK